MPFPGLNATGFTALEDSKYFSDVPVDPAMTQEIEGGWEVSRPRYTRAPARVITTGFTDITDAQKTLLFNYYAAMRGGSASFSYLNPVSGETMTVRFAKPPKAEYAGMGGTHRWDIKNIELKQV